MVLIEHGIEIEIKDCDTDMFRRSSTSTVMLATPHELDQVWELETKDDIDIITQTTIHPSWWKIFSKPYLETSEEKMKMPETLFVVVSRSIKEIAYSIPERIKEVAIMQSHPAQDANDMHSLCINKSSTYCNIETWRWDYQEECTNHSITHERGMYFDSDSLTRGGLDFNYSITSNMTPEGTEQVKQRFQGFIGEEEEDDDQSLGGSASRRPSAPTHTDSNVRWFQRLLKLVAGVAGAAVGVTTAVASLSFCWFNAGGFFVKGPLGLYLSGGYFNMGGLGAVCLGAAAAGLATGIAAGATIYYIPWGNVWLFLKGVLKTVWEKIKNAAFWIWEKLKSLVSDVASKLKQGLTGNAFPHMEKPVIFAG
jgi:hypothetical protein